MSLHQSTDTSGRGDTKVLKKIKKFKKIKKEGRRIRRTEKKKKTTLKRTRNWETLEVVPLWRKTLACWG